VPTPKRYQTNAQRQAAYRQRCAAATQALLATKRLPPLANIPSIPSHPRWRAMAANARTLLLAIGQEMNDYYDQRSDAWRDTEQADDLGEQIEAVQEAIQSLDDYLS
jgi:hypothetical protein